MLLSECIFCSAVIESSFNAVKCSQESAEKIRIRSSYLHPDSERVFTHAFTPITSTHPVNLTHRKYQTGVRLSLALVGRACLPSHPEFEPRLSGW